LRHTRPRPRRVPLHHALGQALRPVMAAPDHEGLDGLGALEGADRLESARCLTTWVVLQDAVAAAPSMANAHRHGGTSLFRLCALRRPSPEPVTPQLKISRPPDGTVQRRIADTAQQCNTCIG